LVDEGRLVDLWGYHRRVGIDFNRTGRLTDYAFVESFNGTQCNEYLNVRWFASISHAKEIAEASRLEYKESRPQGAHGEVPPAEFACRFGAHAEAAANQAAEDSLRDRH